jgi:tetratricopeptide (TPR) repeat protein
MSRENVLFSLVGVGFGLFFGFLFVTWANHRDLAPRATNTPATTAGTETGATNAQSSIVVADQQRAQAVLADAVQRARTNPQDFDAQMLAGGVAYKAEQLDEALEFFQKASDLKPAEVEPVVQLGNVNYDAGRYEAAEKFYTTALVKKPDDLNVRTDLGLTFLLRQPPQYDRAITEFRRSLEGDPRHEQTLQNLVVALTRKGDKAAARATLKQLQAINPNNPSLPQLQAELQ